MARRMRTQPRQLGLRLAGESEAPPTVPPAQKDELLGALQELLVRFAEATTSDEEKGNEALVEADR